MDELGICGGKMKLHLQKIREPNTNTSMRAKILASIAVIILGFLLGIFQKWLDSAAYNELPQLFQQLDITNYFGRLAIWIFLAAVISVYASTPIRASLNTFLFFISMVSGYYIYCNYILGFLPKSYMLIWIVMTFASPFLAYLCWYAKGKGIVSIIISAGILGVLFSQAFLLTLGFRVTHLPEVMTWAAAFLVLRRKPKEFALEFGLSLVLAFVYQLFIPYWG